MSIGWNYQTAPGVAGSAPLTIYLQNTTDTTNTKSNTWTNAIAGMMSGDAQFRVMLTM